MIGYALPDSHTNAVQHHESAHHAVDFPIWISFGIIMISTKVFSAIRICSGVWVLFFFGDTMIYWASCARKTLNYKEARFAEELVFFCIFSTISWSAGFLLKKAPARTITSACLTWRSVSCSGFGFFFFCSCFRSYHDSAVILLAHA